MNKVLQITQETFIKRWPVPSERLLEDEKIFVSLPESQENGSILFSPCNIELHSYFEEELEGENWDGHIKVTFLIPEGYTTWYVHKEGSIVVDDPRFPKLEETLEPPIGSVSKPSPPVTGRDKITRVKEPSISGSSSSGTVSEHSKITQVKKFADIVNKT